MRVKGSKTNVNCWKIEVVNQNNIIFEGEYTTLKAVANELGFSYNQVVEISSGRKKQSKGRFDTFYKFIKINKKDCLEEEVLEVVSKVEGDAVVVDVVPDDTLNSTQ